MGKRVVIGVRIPENVKKEIEELGFKVPAFVKEAVEEELRRRRSGEALNWIRANRVLGKQIGFNSVKVIRQSRETL